MSQSFSVQQISTQTRRLQKKESITTQVQSIAQKTQIHSRSALEEVPTRRKNLSQSLESVLRRRRVLDPGSDDAASIYTETNVSTWGVPIRALQAGDATDDAPTRTIPAQNRVQPAPKAEDHTSDLYGDERNRTESYRGGQRKRRAATGSVDGDQRRSRTFLRENG